MGELGDAGQEYKSQVGVAGFQWTVEIAHDVTQSGQVFVLVHHVQQGGIVFVDEHHHLVSGLLVGALYQALQALVTVYFAFSFPIDLFVLQ